MPLSEILRLAFAVLTGFMVLVAGGSRSLVSRRCATPPITFPSRGSVTAMGAVILSPVLSVGYLAAQAAVARGGRP